MNRKRAGKKPRRKKKTKESKRQHREQVSAFVNRIDAEFVTTFCKGLDSDLVTVLGDAEKHISPEFADVICGITKECVDVLRDQVLPSPAQWVKGKLDPSSGDQLSAVVLPEWAWQLIADGMRSACVAMYLVALMHHESELVEGSKGRKTLSGIHKGSDRGGKVTQAKWARFHKKILSLYKKYSKTHDKQTDIYKKIAEKVPYSPGGVSRIVRTKL